MYGLYMHWPTSTFACKCDTRRIFLFNNWREASAARGGSDVQNSFATSPRRALGMKNNLVIYGNKLVHGDCRW